MNQFKNCSGLFFAIAYLMGNASCSNQSGSLAGTPNAMFNAEEISKIDAINPNIVYNDLYTNLSNNANINKIKDIASMPILKYLPSLRATAKAKLEPFGTVRKFLNHYGYSETILSVAQIAQAAVSLKIAARGGRLTDSESVSLLYLAVISNAHAQSLGLNGVDQLGTQSTFNPQTWHVGSYDAFQNQDGTWSLNFNIANQATLNCSNISILDTFAGPLGSLHGRVWRQDGTQAGTTSSASGSSSSATVTGGSVAHCNNGDGTQSYARADGTCAGAGATPIAGTSGTCAHFN